MGFLVEFELPNFVQVIECLIQTGWTSDVRRTPGSTETCRVVFKYLKELYDTQKKKKFHKIE